MTDRHGYCGRQAHRVSNHDIWRSDGAGHGGPFNMDSYDDLCFAYIGHIQYLSIWASYIKESDGREWRGWMRVPLGYNKQTWTWKCLGLTALLDGAGYGANRKKTRKYFNVGHIRQGSPNVCSN